jgi:hypothetical protein
MENINVVGYYKESKVVNDSDNEKLLYFVAFENSYNNHLNNKKWTEGFNVVDGHFVLRDEKYLISCEKITKEDYINATKGYFTPQEYIA